MADISATLKDLKMQGWWFLQIHFKFISLAFTKTRWVHCGQLITEQGGDTKAGSLLKDGGEGLFGWMTLAQEPSYQLCKNFLRTALQSKTFCVPPSFLPFFLHRD